MVPFRFSGPLPRRHAGLPAACLRPRLWPGRGWKRPRYWQVPVPAGGHTGGASPIGCRRMRAGCPLPWFCRRRRAACRHAVPPRTRWVAHAGVSVLIIYAELSIAWQGRRPVSYPARCSGPVCHRVKQIAPACRRAAAGKSPVANDPAGARRNDAAMALRAARAFLAGGDQDVVSADGRDRRYRRAVDGVGGGFAVNRPQSSPKWRCAPENVRVIVPIPVERQGAVQSVARRIILLASRRPRPRSYWSGC